MVLVAGFGGGNMRARYMLGLLLPLWWGVVGVLFLFRRIDGEEAKFLFWDSLAWLAGKKETPLEASEQTWFDRLFSNAKER